MLLLDWIPGYCRFYVMPHGASGAYWLPFLRNMKPQWRWQWHALWGFRLVCRLGLIDAFANEYERRHREQETAGQDRDPDVPLR
jgi:hypothetical protein